MVYVTYCKQCLTCDSEMNDISVFIINSPVGISNRIYKFYQISKLGSGHDLFNLVFIKKNK